MPDSIVLYMTHSKFSLLLCTVALAVLFSCSQQKEISAPAPLFPVPTDRQLAWHELEQYAFIHFTTNTFTGLEWGYGDESPGIFNPSELDAEQWVKIIKEAGLKGLILTAKHHDGFCLWPSQFTDHTIKASPYKNGKGDLVKEVWEACKKHDIKFGVYLSPWDRNRADYGEASYVEYYRNQLKELFANYGPVFEMWFDGANGGDGYYGGKRERRRIDGATYYDWPTTLAMIREMEPEVIMFSDAGPDIRWCGNEKGYVGETNWNTIDNDTLYAGKPGLNKLLNSGSEGGKDWIPAEVDVSIRPGWFYHKEEDAKVKSSEELFDIYLSSVGRGSNLLINIPPDRRGLIHEIDEASLRGWKKMLDEAFKNNLSEGAIAIAGSFRGNSKQFSADKLIDGNKETYWATDDDVTAESFEIAFSNVKKVSYVTLKEYIKLGQRVRSFSIDAWQNDSWQEIANGTTIGYLRIVKIDPVETIRIRVNILDARACPVLSEVAIY
jgi:alpha-L-fucosidase